MRKLGSSVVSPLSGRYIFMEKLYMKKIILVIMLLMPTFVFADDYGKIPETFFAMLKDGKHNEAIEYLYGTNQWVSGNSAQVLNLKNQLASLDGLVGKYHFHELIVEKKVGEHYAHLIYLVGYDRQPLRFELQVYRVGSAWRLQGVSFDSNLIDDIKSQANMNLGN